MAQTIQEHLMAEMIMRKMMKGEEVTEEENKFLDMLDERQKALQEKLQKEWEEEEEEEEEEENDFDEEEEEEETEEQREYRLILEKSDWDFDERQKAIAQALKEGNHEKYKELMAPAQKPKKVIVDRERFVVIESNGFITLQNGTVLKKDTKEGQEAMAYWIKNRHW